MSKIKRIALLAAFVGTCLWSGRAGAESDESVLLWMLDDPMIEEVNGGPSVHIADLVGRGDAAGKTANAVRVVAASGGTTTWLDVKTAEADAWTSYLSLPDVEGDNCAGPAYANLAGFDLANDPSLSFMIEIGNFSDDTWVTLAVSQAGTVSQLEDFIRSAQLAQYGELEWTGGTYAVPEPTSGVLMLVGWGLLALRRRKAVRA